ncbi:hypothetical protein [Providencia rettgeri]|uniref:hypothetical protein n=1 Tax=Providencia rettgeri TaxID=587 RepID=UPI000197CC73|nr:hypothetical protein [Providencia rettgeri]QXA59588.1 hypothetical protein I6L79_08805 [Providencia rettgeri]
MQKIKLIALVSGLGVLTFLSSTSALAGEASTVATATSNIMVNSTGNTTLSVTPSESILAGKYDSSITLGTWSASTSVGSLAFRLNPATMTSTTPRVGTATSKENSRNTIPVVLTSSAQHECIFARTSSINGWNVCEQGLTSAGGNIILNGNGVSIAPGTYPLSLDAAIWAY